MVSTIVIKKGKATMSRQSTATKDGNKLIIDCPSGLRHVVTMDDKKHIIIKDEGDLLTKNEFEALFDNDEPEDGDENE